MSEIIKRPYFQKIPVHASNEIDENQEMRNNDKLGDYEYFGWGENVAPYTTNLEIRRSNDFEAAHEVVFTFTFTGSAAAGHYIFHNVVTRVCESSTGQIIQVAFYLESVTGTGPVLKPVIKVYHSTTGEIASWSDDSIVTSQQDTDGRAHDIIFKATGMGSPCPVIYQDNLNLYVAQKLSSDTITIDNADGYFGGYEDYDTEIFFFLVRKDAAFKVYSVDVSGATVGTITFVETISAFSAPISYDTRIQQFWYDLARKTYFMMNNTNYYWYDFTNLTWSNYTLVLPTKVNGVVWDRNAAGEIIIPFVTWSVYIIQLTAKGVMKKIQAVEPRDYKKIYLSNSNENLAGVIPWQDDNGNTDLSQFSTQGNVTVIPLLNGHKYVVEIHDDSGAYHYLLWDKGGTYDQESDSVEIFLAQSLSGSVGNTFLFIEDNSNEKVYIWWTASGDIYYGGTLVGSFEANEYIHIRVDYECGAGGYLGLGADQANMWINGVQVITAGNFYLGRTAASLTKIRIRSAFAITSPTYKIYVDSLFVLSEGGSLGSNKLINGYVGHGSDIGEAWFSTGDKDTGIMQLSFLEYQIGTRKALVQHEIYKAPECALNRTTPPFEDESIDLYNAFEQLYYSGKVIDNENDNRFLWIYRMKSWQDENTNTKINENLVQYTYKEMLEFILDTYSKFRYYGRGTNVNVEEFDLGLTDWTNIDGASCVSSYLAKKAFMNADSGNMEYFKDILQQFDNDGATLAKIEQSVGAFTVCSFWIANSDLAKFYVIVFFEGATLIGEIALDVNEVQWYDGAFQTLQAANADTMYHCAIVFSATEANVYINGIFNSTQNLANNIVSAVDKIRFNTSNADSNYYGYASQLYIGDSLVAAMHSLSSISPLLTTKYNFNLKNHSIPNLYKLIVEETGYIVSERPDGQVYVDQYAPSGITINANESQGITFQSRMLNKSEKFSLIIFYGGFINGRQITAIGFGEPNFGTYEDWFPTIQGQDPDDIYYDADGNPKSHRLDALITTALINRNITVKKMTMGKRGVGFIPPGTSLTFNHDHYDIDNETWNLWRKSMYNGLTDDNRPEIADSLLGPTNSDSNATVQEKTDAAIEHNAENIVKTEQNVGLLEENANSSEGQGLTPAWENVNSNENYAPNPNVDNFNLDQWDDLSGTDCFITILTYDSKKHTVKLDDQSGANRCEMQRTLATSFTSGFYSLFWRREGFISSGYLTFDLLRSDAATAIQLQIDDSKLQYKDLSGVVHDIISVSLDITYHICLQFDCSTDLFTIWINGFFIAKDLEFRTAVASIDRHNHQTRNSHSAYQDYLTSFYIGDSIADAFSSLFDGSIQCKGLIVAGDPDPWKWKWRDSDVWDFTEVDFAATINWQDLDLSAIVGSEPMEIIIHIMGLDNATGSEIRVRTKGFTGINGTGVVSTHIANQESHDDKRVETDADGIVEVKIDPLPANWTSIWMFVRAYRYG